MSIALEKFLMFKCPTCRQPNAPGNSGSAVLLTVRDGEFRSLQTIPSVQQTSWITITPLEDRIKVELENTKSEDGGQWTRILVDSYELYWNNSSCRFEQKI